MFKNNDMSGKLIFISRMRILAGLALIVQLIAVCWVLAFYFLYTSSAVVALSLSWMIFIGLFLPYNWPGAIVCGLLSMFLPPDAVLIITAAVYFIAIILVNRAVWLPNPQNYDFLVRGMKIEIAKYILVMILGCFMALIDTNGQIFVGYLIIAIYEIGSAISIFIFYTFLQKLDKMDYREIFQTDGKTPYGQ